LEVIPDPHSGAEHDRDDRDVQEVDEVGLQKLSDGRRPAADPDVQTTGRLLRQPERLVGQGVDEVEAGAVGELEALPRVVREDVDGSQERWRVAPPTLPSV